MKYIDRFPKPLLEDIVRNRCIPIVGAGFSLNAEVPAGKRLPLWDKLAGQLGEELPDYPKSSPIDVISAYAHEFSKSKLIEKLHDLLLIDSARPGATHAAFCSCQFDMVVTTNFDFLLERGYEKVGRYCQPVVEEDQLPIAARDPQVTVLKLHGDLNHPTRLVATEDDYDLFLENYPLLSTYLANLLIVRTPLLIGYSLDDPDFRHIWQLIGDRLGRLRRPAYVLTVGSTASDIARYERRGVKVLNLPGRPEEYPGILEKVFSEIRTYWSDKLPSVSTTLEDGTSADLALPAEATTRLCYFAVGASKLPFYRSAIFPLAVRHGLTPVTADDVISPGDSVAGRVSAIVSRADIVVVDGDERWVTYELSNISKKARVLMIRDRTDLPMFAERWEILTRPGGDYWSNDSLVHYLDKWFEKVSQQLMPALMEEPSRLLGKGEHRAALISAIALLESQAWLLFGNGNLKNAGRRPSAMRIIDYLETIGQISDQTKHSLHRWIYLRNLAVHEGRDIDKRDARAAVQGILNLVSNLREARRETAAASAEDLEDIPL